MKTFKTPKGTELPLLDLKGKDYLQVAWRVKWFREDHPNGTIETERVSESEKQITYRATITCDGKKLANADKTLQIKTTLDYEKCETGAIGRALALCGYGTQFADDDLNEGDNLSDGPLERQKDPATAYFDSVPPESNLNEEIPSFDELPKVPVKSKIAEVQKQLKKIGSFVITVGSWKNKTLDEVVEEHGLGELRSRFNFWNKNDGKPKGQIMRELIDAVGIYLDANGGR